MICNDCKTEFEPIFEQRRLMVAGHIGQLCDACARKASLFKPPAHVAKSTQREIYTQIRQVDVHKPDSDVRRYMKLEPDRRIKRRPVRHDRFDPHPFVMSEKGSQLTNIPIERIRTNYPDCLRKGQDVWIRRTPGGFSPMTGLDEVTVKLTDIASIEDDGGMKVVFKLKDGGWVRVLFKN